MFILLLGSLCLILKYFVNISCNLRINTNHESYIDVKLFEKIKTVYNTIDFFGSYDLGDVSTYEIYKKKYQQFLQGERPVIDKYTGESLYIWESELNNYKIDQFTYYYFDMDGDNYPELCIQDEVSTLYIIKYEAKTDEILLWMRSVRAPIYVLGTKKLIHTEKDSLGKAYIELNENGEWKFSLWLKKEMGIFFITFPHYYDQLDKEKELSDEIRKQGIFNEHQKLYYFRVTEKQYNELSENYEKSVKLSMEKIKTITYTYEELFNEKYYDVYDTYKKSAEQQCKELPRKYIEALEEADKNINEVEYTYEELFGR